MDSRHGLTDDERAELERLRAEVATLRAQARQPEATSGGGVVAGRAARQRWRTVIATLLIVLGCVLAPLAGVAVWARNQVTNTDRYLATVAPLASDPAIQNAIADQITAQVFTYLDVRGLTTQALDALAERGSLPPQVAGQLRALSTPIANGVQSFTRTQVGRIVQSPAFTDAWVQANRLAHQELVKALTGEGNGAITVEGDTVSINLAAFIATVKQQLVANGFSLAERIPAVSASFVLFQSKDITRVRSGFNLLNTLGVWLPIIMLILLVLGVYVAKDHRRALVGAAVGVAVSMVVLALALAIFRSIYLDAVPANLLPHDAAAVLYDTIVRFLRLGLRTILVLALVVAAGAFLSGQSVTAVRTREGLGRAIGWLQGGAEQAGFSTGPVGAWVYGRKRALRIGAGRPGRWSSASPWACWWSWPSSSSWAGGPARRRRSRPRRRRRSVHRHLQDHDDQPEHPVDRAGGQGREPGPALAAGVQGGPGDQLDHAQPQGQPDGLTLLQDPEPAQGQQQQQRERALEQRPLLDHGPSHHRPVQPPRAPEMVGQGVGVHVGQPEHEQGGDGQRQRLAVLRVLGGPGDHRHGRDRAVDRPGALGGAEQPPAGDPGGRLGHRRSLACGCGGAPSSAAG
jgi:hypothetical protein